VLGLPDADSAAPRRHVGRDLQDQPRQTGLQQLDAGRVGAIQLGTSLWDPPAVDRLGRIRPTRLADRDVARIVKRTAQLAGLDPARYAGHSLRAGLATSAAAAGVEERQIMAQTRHKSVTVARRYIRDGSLFRSNAAGQVGL